MEHIEVTLIGPAKINGRWRKPGETHLVSEGVLNDLRAGGAVSAEGGAVIRSAPDVAMTSSEDFDRAVAERAKALAETMTGAAIEAAIAVRIGEIEKGADERIALLEGEHRAELEAVDHELDAAKARIAELEAKVLDLEAGLVAEADRANAAEAALATAGLAGSGTAGKAGKPAK